MKHDEIYDAIAGIDEKYIAQAEDIEGVSGSFRRARNRRIAAVTSLCGCAVVMIGAMLAAGLLHREPGFGSTSPESGVLPVVTEFLANTTSPNPETTAAPVVPDPPTEPHQVAGTDPIDPDITAPADPVDEASEECTDAPDAPVDSDPGDPGAAFPGDPGSDGLPVELYYPSLSQWIADPDVIWGTSSSKGEPPPMNEMGGTFAISDSLNRLMDDGDTSDVYAIIVDFSACVDQSEMDNWDYNGSNIADLRDNTDRTSMEQIKEITNAYYSMKIESFTATFHAAGLGIYTEPWATTGKYFYTFATPQNLRMFTCADDEAFVFYPADRIK